MKEYKVKQLKIMLDEEAKSKPDAKYGAHLTHWSGKAKSINIDEGALQVLIDYYSAKIDFNKE